MNAHHKLRSILAVASLLVAPSVATAAWTFENGNLLLGVQATGGTGASTNVFFNLGSATAFRDGQITGVRGNISADLVAAYGANWYSRTDLHFGVIGNLSSSPNSGLGAAAPVAGDPSRTVYVSAAAATPGSAAIWTGYTSNSLGVAGSRLTGQEEMVRTLNPTASGAAVLSQTDSVSWENSWTKWNPSAGPAYDIFTGMIQASFGQSGGTTYVDVQRILPTNTGANPTGSVGTGAYEGSVGITSGGDIVITAGSTQPQGGYDTWIATFPALDTPAKRLPTADPDGDGLENLLEFLLNGNPGTPDTSILPTLNATGANFVFTFNRRDDAKAGSTLIFQYGSNLTSWTDVPVGETGGTVGSASIGVVDNGTNPDQITITVPKSVATGGKLFGRIRYTQP
ncbi:hypothetical protein OKA04_09465 [Luteolibacter flavescens]|uniref:PEP-CTERM sorting domain-containing protein n=1 Tax=Luteolibacter flavescens TaxID=1859460 RepID=A0ABT3FN07_9BACT|nr:hypothetical protein [Luteolibacter flavescens]MCW1884955.1 hypothetical protein [Luteolibacter flavescens]